MTFRSSFLRQLSNKSSYAPSSSSTSRGARTIVRDPRKNKNVGAKSLVADQQGENPHFKKQLMTQESNQEQKYSHAPMPPPFAPSQENQQSIGSSFVSYALAGAGMTLGFVLVGAIFGL